MLDGTMMGVVRRQLRLLNIPQCVQEVTLDDLPL
jgi:hypothetical protein